MPTQGNDETGVHCEVIQDNGGQALVLSDGENWAADPSTTVVCRNPADLSEWQ